MGPLPALAGPATTAGPVGRSGPRGAGLVGSLRAGDPAAVDPAPGRATWLRRLPAHWPLTLCIGGFPLWWALGAGPFAWSLFAVPLAVRLLLQRRPIRVPLGFGLWVLWLAFVGLSFFALDGDGPPLAYAFRLVNVISCTVWFLAIASATEDEIPSPHVVRLLSGFWLVTVAGGWLGTLLPDGELPSLVQSLAPGSIATHEFFEVLTVPSFAQVHDFLGYPLGRPKAPFVYTNDWGSAYALLLPFFLLAWLQAADLRRRSWAYLLLAASLVPVFVSLNRGMWLSLGVAFVYAASRSGEVARLARRALVALITLGLLIVAFTPVGSVVEGRVENDHSSAGRLLLYEEAVRITAESPIIGLGGPQPYEGNRIIPFVGTQGTLWMVLVSTGFVGLGLFLGAWLRFIWETRAGPVLTFWCHVVLIVGLVQLLVYDLIPSSLHIVLIAAALGTRAALDRRGRPGPGASGEGRGAAPGRIAGPTGATSPPGVTVPDGAISPPGPGVS